jgi:hypothetical protein
MVTPKGSMLTEGETFKVSVLPYRGSKCCFLLCLSWLLCSRVRKFWRELWITLYASFKGKLSIRSQTDPMSCLHFKGNTVLPNYGNYLRIETELHGIKLWSSSALIWEPQISHSVFSFSQQRQAGHYLALFTSINTNCRKKKTKISILPTVSSSEYWGTEYTIHFTYKCHCPLFYCSSNMETQSYMIFTAESYRYIQQPWQVQWHVSRLLW